MTIKDDIDGIHTQKELAAFVNKLHEDYVFNSGSWENRDLTSYLNAIAAWISDSDGYYQNMNLQEPDAEAWQTVARVLLAAKTYE